MDKSITDAINEKNEYLLQEAAKYFGADWITPEIRKALFDTYRHLFIPRFLSSTDGDWSQIDESNLGLHLDTLYANYPLCIYRDPAGRSLSTISQPSLVLYMLSLLDLKPGMTVFELGGGSGWNAALMSRLVGENGRIYSLEIIPELVENAKKTLSRLKIDNVSITHDDAYQGLAEHAPFDRGVFTASAYDLPKVFFDQIAENGILLFVTQLNPGSDLLTVLRKRGSTFISELHFQCRFVPVMKKKTTNDLNLEHQSTKIARIHKSMSKESLKRGLEIDDFDLRILPSKEVVIEKPNQWIDDRGDAKFVWSLGDRVTRKK